MRYAWLIVLAVVATTGCNQAELKKALAEAKAAEAQKDSLLTEVLETTQFVTDINGELAKAKSMSVKSASTDPGVPGAKKDREERLAALERVKQVIARLNESESKLAETETRAKQSRQRNARLLAQIETYKKTIDDLQTTAEQQKTEYEAALAEKDTQIATLAGPGGHAHHREVAARERQHGADRHRREPDRLQEHGLLRGRDQGRAHEEGRRHEGGLQVPGLRRHPAGAGAEPDPEPPSPRSTRPSRPRSRCRGPTRSTRSSRRQSPSYLGVRREQGRQGDGDAWRSRSRRSSGRRPST